MSKHDFLGLENQQNVAYQVPSSFHPFFLLKYVLPVATEGFDVSISSDSFEDKSIYSA